MQITNQQAIELCRDIAKANDELDKVCDDEYKTAQETAVARIWEDHRAIFEASAQVQEEVRRAQEEVRRAHKELDKDDLQ